MSLKPFAAPAAAALSLALLALAGCASGGANNGTAAAPGSGAGSATAGAPSSPGVLKGRAAVGPSQLSGAHVYLYAANTTAYGAYSLSLLDPAAPGVATDTYGNYVLTDAQGSFALTGAYHCVPGELVYVLARGGSPNGEANNPNVSLLSIFGVCPAAGDFSEEISYVNMNQVSTVVSVAALAGFMTDATHVASGPSANAITGLTNAFLAMGNLMDISVGSTYPYTQDGSGVIPQAEIDTLANIIVPCSNDPAACGALFNLAHDLAGNAPYDTVTALLNILRNPGANVPALFALAGAQPFRPALAAAPNDWTVGITYYAENMAGAYFPAIDAKGNVWVPGYANNTLTEFDPLGHVLSGDAGFSGGGLAQPFAIAIDSNGNPWVTNYGSAAPGSPSVSEFAPNGTPITSNGFSCGSACSFIAVDATDNLWVSAAPNVSVLRPSGVKLSGFSTNGSGSGIAVDSQGRGWAIGSGRNLSRLTMPGTVAQFSEGVTAAAGNEVNAVAIDAADSVWFSSPKNNALGRYSGDGQAISPAAGYTGGGLKGPVGLAVDGSGRVWVANRDGNSVSSFLNSGTAVSPPSGYLPQGLSNPRGIAVDPSGNVWLTSFTGNSVTELLGAATPTATPSLPSNHGRLP